MTVSARGSGRPFYREKVIAICALVEAPATPGTLELQWDVIQDGVGWFSTLDHDNQYAERIRITDDSADQPRFNPRALARLIIFLLVTGGHFFVMATVLRRHTATWGLTSLDDWLFCTITIGFGTLLAVLHTLAATIGMSFASGVALIVILDTILLWWGRGSGSARRSDPAHSNAPVPDPSFQVPVLAIPGLVIVTALLLQWYAVTSVSLRIAGIDAAHYHVPHALNFAHGTTLFGFLATPHVYPMATSVWAAWVLQPLSGPLLLDLVTLPGLLVLLASFGLLFRLATGTPGIVWAPWVVLLMLTAPIVRLSLLPSADLFYAAAFVAMFTWCFRIWRNGVVRTPDFLGLAVMSGWLVGTKVTGVLSMVSILAVFGLLFGVRRYLFSRPPITCQVSRIAVGLGVTAFFGAGGIWLIRNWVLFESPLAPSGLVLAGWTIFPGEGYLGRWLLPFGARRSARPHLRSRGAVRHLQQTPDWRVAAASGTRTVPSAGRPRGPLAPRDAMDGVDDGEARSAGVVHPPARCARARSHSGTVDQLGVDARRRAPLSVAAVVALHRPGLDQRISIMAADIT